jgi:hypothetical protein
MLTMFQRLLRVRASPFNPPSEGEFRRPKRHAEVRSDEQVASWHTDVGARRLIRAADARWALRVVGPRWPLTPSVEGLFSVRGRTEAASPTPTDRHEPRRVSAASQRGYPSSKFA